MGHICMSPRFYRLIDLQTAPFTVQSMGAAPGSAGVTCIGTCVVSSAVLRHMELTAQRDRASQANLNHSNFAPDLVPGSDRSKALPLLMTL